jgi:Amidohydrolase family
MGFMKILRKSLKITFILLGALLLLALIILWMDTRSTSYLKIENIEKASNNSYLITNVNIVPMNMDTILADKMIYIADGLIKKIADSIDIKNVEVIDAKNKYLTPGLIDMHVHVWDKYELGLYLSNGVTAIRNLWGMPMHLRIKEEINQNKIIAPMLYTSGPKLTGPEFIGDDNLQLTNPLEAKEKVLSYKQRGYDFIKTYYGLPEDIFDAIIEQATASDIDIVAHPSQKVPYSYHLHPQIKSIEHAEDIVQQPLQFNMTAEALQPIVDSISISKHTRFCPTITVFNNIYSLLVDDSILVSKPLGFMNPLIKKVDSKNQYDRWQQAKAEDEGIVERIKNQHDFHLMIISKLHEAGVPIVCGTDAGIGVTIPGFSIHQELAFYKEAGLSNYEVLKTATVNAAKTHSMMNQFGTIEENKIANLLLIDKNPLMDLSSLKNPDAVFIQGRKLNSGTLHSFKEKAMDRKNLIASSFRYLENLIIEK